MPHHRFRVLAVATACMTWFLVAVGGVVRVSESGLGCPDWPLCSGRAIPLAQRAPIIEFSHRATTTIVSLLVVACAVLAWKQLRHRPDIRRYAITAALLLPVQALLGALVVWLETPPWLVAFHFVVGMLFMGCTVVVAARSNAIPSDGRELFVRASWIAVGAALSLVVAGASVVAAGAEEACGRSWPACQGQVFARDGLGAVQATHRILAYLVAALVIYLAITSWRRGRYRRTTAFALCAVVAQAVLGVALVLTHDHTMAHGTIEVAHVAGAGLVWAALVALFAQVTMPVLPDSTVQSV